MILRTFPPLSSLITFFTLLTITHAQQQSLLARLYNAQDKVLIASLPNPLPANYFVLQLQQLLQTRPAYLRIVTSTSTGTALSSAENSLQQPSTHSEERSAQRVKVVLWSHLEWTSPVMEVHIRAIMDFCSRLAQLKRGGDQPTEGQPVNLTATFLPASIMELEVEVVSLGDDQFIRHGLCRRTATTNGTTTNGGVWPCPSAMLVEQGLVPALGGLYDLLMPLDRLVASTGSTAQALVADFATPQLAEYYQQNQQLWGAPAFLDNRLLAFNVTTLKRLQLKLPPPYADWGSVAAGNLTWTWDVMMEYALKIKQAGFSHGFQFQSHWDEENKLIPLMVKAFGSNSLMQTKDNATCDKDGLQSVLGRTVGKLWQSDKSANMDFLQSSSPSSDLQDWLNSPLGDPLRLLPLFSQSSSQSSTKPIWGPGFTWTAGHRIRHGLRADGSFLPAMPQGDLSSTDAELLPCWLPGPITPLLGSGFVLLKRSLNPSIAWSMVQFILSPLNSYVVDAAIGLHSMPAYTSQLNQQPTLASLQLVRSQMQLATPVLPPSTSADWIDRKPLRQLLMEMALKQRPSRESAQRACELISTFVLPPCNQTRMTQRSVNCDASSGYRFVNPVPRSLMTATCKLSVDRTTLNQVACPFVPLESSSGSLQLAIALTALVLSLVLLLMFFYNNNKMKKNENKNNKNRNENRTKGIVEQEQDSSSSSSSLLLHSSVLGVGVVLVLASNLAWIGLPHPALCVLRGWSLTLGQSLVMASLLASMTQQQVTVSPHRHVALTVAGLMAIECVLLLIWTLVPVQPGLQMDVRDVVDLELGSALTLVTPMCSAGQAGTLYTLFALNLVLMLVAFAQSLWTCCRLSRRPTEMTTKTNQQDPMNEVKGRTAAWMVLWVTFSLGLGLVMGLRTTASIYLAITVCSSAGLLIVLCLRLLPSLLVQRTSSKSSSVVAEQHVSSPLKRVASQESVFGRVVGFTPVSYAQPSQSSSRVDSLLWNQNEEIHSKTKNSNVMKKNETTEETTTEDEEVVRPITMFSVHAERAERAGRVGSMMESPATDLRFSLFSSVDPLPSRTPSMMMPPPSSSPLSVRRTPADPLVQPTSSSFTAAAAPSSPSTTSPIRKSTYQSAHTSFVSDARSSLISWTVPDFDDEVGNIEYDIESEDGLETAMRGRFQSMVDSSTSSNELLQHSQEEEKVGKDMKPDTELTEMMQELLKPLAERKE